MGAWVGVCVCLRAVQVLSQWAHARLPCALQAHVCCVIDYMFQDWQLGILTNLARMPMRQMGAQEPDIKMALQFHQHDWYKVPLWPLIAKIDVMTPHQLTQVSVGYHNPKAIQVARCLRLSPSRETTSLLQTWCGRLVLVNTTHSADASISHILKCYTCH